MCLLKYHGISHFVSWYLSYMFDKIFTKGVVIMNQQRTGEFLKHLRKEKELTQEQLAEYFFVSSRTVSRWENGLSFPDISLLIPLSELLNVSLYDLLTGGIRDE